MSDNHGGLYNLINAHEKRIASLVVEVELKNKEIRKWKEAWQQADDEAYQYAAELKSLREFCRTEIRKMPPALCSQKDNGRLAMSSFFMWVGNEGFVGHEYLAAEKAWEYQQERIDVLEAENKEIQHALDCMVTSTWELQESYNAMMEIAGAVWLSRSANENGYCTIDAEILEKLEPLVGNL